MLWYFIDPDNEFNLDCDIDEEPIGLLEEPIELLEVPNDYNRQKCNEEEEKDAYTIDWSVEPWFLGILIPIPVNVLRGYIVFNIEPSVISFIPDYR